MKCNFCEDLFQKNREQGFPEEETILYKDDNIYVIPDISPLTVGHLLVISKKHFQGFASADMETMESLQNFFLYYRKKISNRNFTVFEHGAVSPNTAGASIDHAHMHVLPFDIEINERITEEFGNPSKYSLENFIKLKERKQPYFFCMRSSNKEGWIYEVEKVPSQILRKMASELLDMQEHYDWKLRYSDTFSHIQFYKTFAWWKSLNLSDSFKWKKKILLEKYGFITYRGVINEINRFSKDDVNILRMMLEKELEKGQVEEKCYRVVLVPQHHNYYLPNQMIYKKEDLCKLEEFCSKDYMFDEIWYMENRLEGREKYSGRLSVYKQGDFSEVIIEMIQGDDLRKLDQYSLGKENMEYFRARKKIGESVFTVEENNMMSFSDGFLRVFAHVKRAVTEYNSQIQFLSERLCRYDVRVFSIDFRVEDTRLIFIDWDTSDDEKVLKYELV